MKTKITNQGKWHQSLIVKLGLLAFMGLLLLIPLEMIKFLSGNGRQMLKR